MGEIFQFVGHEQTTAEQTGRKEKKATTEEICFVIKPFAGSRRLVMGRSRTTET
jgi:hypothetical protein